MHSDGVAYEGNLLFVLQLLAARVAAATASGGDMAQMVDVLSLSLGYFSETLSDASYTAGLWNAIDILLGMGIAVTASAGNYSTSRRCYPAAFADRKPAQHPAAPLISVGALNPNGSKALFSDDGPWVRAWATGAAIISTFPVDLNGSREPQVRPAHPSGDMRESLDPDNYKDGFAVWSGTSFSAPLVAAQLAGELLAGADGPNGQRLDQGGTDAAVSRITRALQNLGWPG
jgi:subtilisin family serine protease